MVTARNRQGLGYGAVAAVCAAVMAAGLGAQGGPSATLVPAVPLALPGQADSNSPVVWDLVGGRRRLFVMTSVDGAPSLSTGPSLARLGAPAGVNFWSHPGHGIWMETIIVDEGGTWYGYYHNEVPAELCGRLDRTMPRIGAARSTDRGATWVDLGIILEAPPGWHVCATPNQYFVGGVGDFSAVLDHESRDLYIFFSQYSAPAWAQGVAVARMAWADRDEPAGRVAVWSAGLWLPPREVPVDLDSGGPPVGWSYPAGTPLVRPTRPWHADTAADAFWGPSVHWNPFLDQYVMLLNRTKDERWSQEGIYVSFAPALDDPSLWSPPQRLLTGGAWYPQVVGLEPGEGTDKVAGRRARFFIGGASSYFLEFSR